MDKAIKIIDTMVEELESKKEPYNGMSNYSEIQDQIDILLEAKKRMENGIKGEVTTTKTKKEDNPNPYIPCTTCRRHRYEHKCRTCGSNYNGYKE